MSWTGWVWRWTGRRAAATLGACRACGAELEECSACEGAWRGRNCQCGAGLRCPVHGRLWAR